MLTSEQRPRLSQRFLWSAVALVLTGIALAAVILSPPQAPETPVHAPAVKPAASEPLAEAVVPANPPESFATFRQVAAIGGTDTTRPAAIAWLDCHARENLALPPAEARAVLEVVEKGGHPAWSDGYRQHLFNSIFNALHASDVAPALTKLLHRLAVEDRDRVMRLYALQHLGTQRRAGALTGEPAAAVRATLLKLARDRESGVAGMAVSTLAEWDGPETPLSDEVRELALATVADRSLAVEIRITALHAAGPDVLEPARRIAADNAEPVLLRKAAIARIGAGGGPDDLALLTRIQTESFRLAQATGPARQAIEHRRSHPAKPAPRPY